MGTRVVQVRSGREEQAATEGAEAISAGRLVAFATETVYGIAALTSNLEAMERLRELKDRPSRPFSVHIARPQDACRYVRRIPPPAERLMRKAWPGPLTLVLPVGKRLADASLHRLGVYRQLCWEGQIGLRCPDWAVTQSMLEKVSAPVVAPSANRAGAPSPRTGREVLEALDGQIDLLIDSGPTRYGTDSTIVRCDGEDWQVLRKGVYDTAAIRRLLRQRWLFACTGNTCRSPIAAGLARKMIAECLKCTVQELPARGFDVVSAGVFAADGLPPSPEAVRAVRRHGVDISRHRSRKLTDELIRSADLVLCMAQDHVAEVRRRVPTALARTRRLDPCGDISDPIGAGAGGYGSTADRIACLLKELIAKEVP